MHKDRLPVIFGCASTRLSTEEVDFFSRVKPTGYILFSRNIESRSQVQELTAHLRSISNDPKVPILIDQEGGRVARLKPPLTQIYPTASYFAELAQKDMNKACQSVKENYYKIGLDLRDLGINTNCAPVADLRIEGADSIIGDRSFGNTVEMASTLCKFAIQGLVEAGIQPIVKHIPGHGRASCDSHHALPVVSEKLETLDTTDFQVFRNLNGLPVWAMTAHITYTALDPTHCLTVSHPGIQYVRQNLGYQSHTIISDDLSMKALHNSVGQNALDALKAGCDLALHCNGNIEEMRELVAALDDAIIL